jgi:signal peptidase II
MTGGRRRVRRWAVIVAIVAAVAGLDLWTKRWVEDRLATPRHLLPVAAPAGAAGMTVGDVVRTRFPERTDDALRGSLWRLPPQVALDPGDPVFELEAARNVEATGFFVFDTGRPERFARRVDRDDAFRMERGLLKERPGLSLQEARREVRDALAKVSLAEFLTSRLPHLSGEEAAFVAGAGLHPIPAAGADADPGSPAVPGAIYLLGERDIVLIPGVLDLSYAENPAGAFSLLHDVDEDVRRVVFFSLSLVALFAVGWLLWRPPSPGWLPVVALGGIMGGALGNLADRVTLTYVVDFVHMYWRDFHWPRYNVADVGISVGVVLLLLVTAFHRDPSPDAGRAVPPPPKSPPA